MAAVPFFKNCSRHRVIENADAKQVKMFLSGPRCPEASKAVRLFRYQTEKD
jgi:hypothetical protein